MLSCFKTAFVRACFSMLVFFAAANPPASAFEIHAPLRSEKLPEDWRVAISPESKGALTATADGALIAVESNKFALLQHDNEARGTDASPLLLSARLKVSPGTDCVCYLYWDDKNYAWIKGAGDSHVYYGWMENGVERLALEYNAMQDVRLADGKIFGKDIFVRMLLVSRNLAFFISNDGVAWRKLKQSEARPGPVDAAPKILFGRGFPGAQAGLKNDLSAEKMAPLKAYISDVGITDHPAPPDEASPDLVKKDTWEQTLAALEPAGIPRAWTFLAPAAEKYFSDPKWTPPEDWNTIKELDGRKVKVISWNRPEEELDDPEVDLREQVEHVKNSVALCKTEIVWPVAGEALLWFDCADPARVYVNNVLVFSSDGREWWQSNRAVKDRRAIPALFAKGRNSVRIHVKQVHGEAEFFFRAERNDAAYRCALIGRMTELFPPSEGGWRSAQALLDAARLREMGFDFDGALKAYARAFTLLKNDEESRLRAFEGSLRVCAFLRDFGGAVKIADAYLNDFPRAEGSAGALRAALHFETLAGRAVAARERINKWNPPGAAVDGSTEQAELLRVIAGAFADARDFKSQLALLDEISENAAFKPTDRARGAIESAVWRWQYEREKYGRGLVLDPAQLELACRSLNKALELLPGAKNPALHRFTEDAQAALKLKKPETALGALWGATLLALTASRGETAYYFALNKSYTLPLPLKDKNGGEIKDQNQFKDEAWRQLVLRCGDAVWKGNWRQVGFKRNAANVGGQAQDFSGPETNADPNAKYGGKGWSDFDPEADKSGRGEFGFDVRRFCGDSQIVYLARDFEMPAAADTVLQLSDCGAWTAWIDGKSVGRELGPDEFRIEENRLALHLEKGQHRLLVKLELAPDSAAFFRARIGAEPHFAMLLYVQALCAEQFPVNPLDRQGDLNPIREALARRTAPGALLGFAEDLCLVYADQPLHGADQVAWCSTILRETNQESLAVGALRAVLRCLEDGPHFPGRGQKAIEVSRALARALVHMGSTAAADAVLRDAANRYVLPASESAQCIAWRGALRRDLGMSQAALPFFERCAREGNLNNESRQIVSPGLEWARFSRPERVLVDSSREVQSQLDGVRRQLAGAPEDAEKAMRALGEILRSNAGALVKIAESPFAARYVGVREYVSSLIESFSTEQRELYRKIVGEAAAQRLARVCPQDPAELESIALEFPHTRESQRALNRAGSLYLDRGRFGQAASLFQSLLREPLGVEAPALLQAKLAVALSLNGQSAESAAALEKLSAQVDAAHPLKLMGREFNSGSALIQRLKEQFKAPPLAAASGESDGQYMGGLLRAGALAGPAPVPGGVLWAHPAIASGALDNARSVYGPDAQSHFQSHPATDGFRVFVGAMESLRAFDLKSGAILWTQTWASASAAPGSAFNGFPSNCPAAGGGRVFIRAQSAFSALKCFDAATGASVWSSDSQLELRKLVWISDPALAYGMVFAVCIEPGDFNLHCVAALDAATGRLRWRTPLVNGSTGIKVNEIYFQSTFHMGPPAVDAGELYVETGLASIAALNAFTGEPRWLSSYPRMALGDLRRGQTSVFEFGARSFKIFSRAPLPPLVAGTRIILAPLDANGVMAFDRRDGNPLWHRELIDARYLAGLAGGNVLACDAGLVALNAETGATAWKVELANGGLIGEPALSGGVLYLPARAALERADALTGRQLDAMPWDARIGPCANLLVTPHAVVAIAENSVAAFGVVGGGATSVPLPFYEARRLEGEGKLEAAAHAYAAALELDKDNLPLAAAARIRILKTLGRRDEALAEITAFERGAPERLSAMGGLWSTRRALIVRSLRKLLADGPPAGAASPTASEAAVAGLKGVLAYADFLPGDNPLFTTLDGDPPGRIYARLNGGIECIDVQASGEGILEVLWSAYVGTHVKKLIAGTEVLAALGDREITVLDRDSGETIARIQMPSSGDLDGLAKDRAAVIRRLRQIKGEAFAQACIQNRRIFTLSDSRLCAWDALTGKQLWGRSFTPNDHPVDSGLLTHDNVLVRVFVHNDLLFAAEYDQASGAELRTLNLERQQRTAFSVDKRYLVTRVGGRLACADLNKFTVLWRKDFSDLNMSYAILEFTPEGLIRYSGPNHNDGNRYTVKHIDPATGNETLPNLVEAQGGSVGGGLFAFAERGFKIARLRPKNGVLEPLWATQIAHRNGVNYSFLKAFIAGPFFHSIHIRSFDNGDHEQLFLRTLSWATGEQLAEQVLPGTPIVSINSQNSQKIYQTDFQPVGAALIYTAKEGLYSFNARGESTARAVDSLRAEIKLPATSAERIGHLRRGLAGLDEPQSMAFITPAEARIDGDLSEWSGSEPLLLGGRENYAALAPDTEWGGAADLSAKIYSGWNQDGITIAVDVADDATVPPRPGAECASGDRVRFVIDGRADNNSTLETGECFIATLALGASGPLFVQEFGAAPESGLKALGNAAPSPTGKGVHYELFVPWTVLRKDARERPGDKREIRVGLAVFDDDGHGVKGALEWGAGAALNPAMPMWLGRMTLIDASAEKIERYRKVIELLPGSPEALKFLKLMLVSKRGPNAGAEGAAELERFIAAHPDGANTVRALAMLQQAYVKMGEANPAARLARFMTAAKIPEPFKQALNCAFKVWVLPDAQKPPRMFMLQFSNNDWNNGVARAYWGISPVPWGRDGSLQMKKFGELPPPGKWSELTVSPFDLGLDGMDVRSFALTFSGGLAHFARPRIVIGGKETVLIDDRIPEHWQTQYSTVEFKDNPRHDGTKSFTLSVHEPAIDLHNTHFNLDAWANIMNFFNAVAEEPVKNSAQLLDRYRQAALILNDSPEGLVFLRRAMELNPEPDAKQRALKSVDEIKAFLKFNPATPNGSSALRLAFEFYSWAAVENPLAACEELIRESKPSIAAVREFYSERVQAWTEWHVLGPYPAIGERRGMEVSTESERAVNLNFKAQVAGRDIAWKKFTSLNPQNPKADASLVDLRVALNAEKESQRGPYFGYAYTRFNCPSKRKALIAFGADDSISIWINGKRVANEIYTYPQKDKEALEVQLRGGENEILIKVGSLHGKLAFVFRVADLDGKPFADIKNE